MASVVFIWNEAFLITQNYKVFVLKSYIVFNILGAVHIYLIIGMVFTQIFWYIKVETKSVSFFRIYIIHKFNLVLVKAMKNLWPSLNSI